MNSKEVVHRVGPRYSTGKKYEDLAEVLPIMPYSSKDLTELLIKLNTETDASRLPSWIAMDLSLLEQNNCPFPVSNVVNLVQNTANLAAIRLGSRPVKLKFSGFVHTSVGAGLVEVLKQNQFVGMTCTIGGHGWEPCVEFNRDLLKEHWIWPKELINNSDQCCGMSANGTTIRLTARQEEILRLIIYRGLSNKQIARQLGISESTVKLHCSILFEKYAVQSRTQLTSFLKQT